MSYLPSESWKYQQTLYSNFNNNLISGINQGLSLYNPEKDLTLYKQIDTKPLDSINFDNINKKLDENNNLYNNAKSTVSGGLSGLIQGSGEGFNNYISNTLGIDSNGIKTYIGLFLIFLLIYKKF